MDSSQGEFANARVAEPSHDGAIAHGVDDIPPGAPANPNAGDRSAIELVSD